MEHEARDPLEEDERDSRKPVDKPSLGERLLGVRTLDEQETSYSSSSSGSLIERMTASDQRLADHEGRKPAEPKRSLGGFRKKKGLAARLKIDIPAGLRVREPKPWAAEAPEAEETTVTARTEDSTPSSHLHAIEAEPEYFPHAVENHEPAAAVAEAVKVETPEPPRPAPVASTSTEEAMAGVAEPVSVMTPELPKPSPTAAEPTEEAMTLEEMIAHIEATRISEPSAPEPTAEAPRGVEAPLSADAVQATAATVAPDATEWKPESAQTAAEVAATLQPAIAAALPPQSSLRAGPGSLESSAGEAERLARLRYNALVSALAVVFGLAIVAGLAVVFAVIGDAEWQLVAIAGGLEALAVVALVALLMFLEHEPLIQAAPTSTEMAQLETARTYMNKSFEFWEKYLTERGDGRPVTAEDVAMAVSSLTAASHNLLDLEAGLAKASAKPKETPREPHRDTKGPTSPTRPTPVRSRPSRY